MENLFSLAEKYKHLIFDWVVRSYNCREIKNESVKIVDWKLEKNILINIQNSHTRKCMHLLTKVLDIKIDAWLSHINRQIDQGLTFTNFFRKEICFGSNYQEDLFFKVFHHYCKRNIMWQGQHAWHFVIEVGETSTHHVTVAAGFAGGIAK